MFVVNPSGSGELAPWDLTINNKYLSSSIKIFTPSNPLGQINWIEQATNILDNKNYLIVHSFRNVSTNINST